jgi:hypothetical protein
MFATLCSNPAATNAAMGGTTGALDGAAVLLVGIGYSAMGVCVYTISMDHARAESAATDFTLQISVLGVVRLGMSSAGLALAGAFGFPQLILASVALAAFGTWFAARWLRGHRVAPVVDRRGGDTPSQQ